MSNAQNKQVEPTAAQPKTPVVPDGKSKLPTTIPDFPATDPNGSGSITNAPKPE